MTFSTASPIFIKCTFEGTFIQAKAKPVLVDLGVVVTILLSAGLNGWSELATALARVNAAHVALCNEPD